MPVVLIIEPEATLKTLLSLNLKARGYTVSFVNDIETTCETAVDVGASVILLDFLPHLAHGFSLLDKLAIHATLHNVPVLITSTTDSAIVTKMTSHYPSIRKIFQKPYQIEDLVKILAQLV